VSFYDTIGQKASISWSKRNKGLKQGTVNDWAESRRPVIGKTEAFSCPV